MRRSSAAGAGLKPPVRRQIGGLAGAVAGRCKRLKTTGTKNRVAIVATTSPPITARPSGAFCSPPSPRPRLMGSMPMIIATAVISTGRSRPVPASQAAVNGSMPSEQVVARKCDHQHGVRRGHAQAHDGPHQARAR